MKYVILVFTLLVLPVCATAGEIFAFGGATPDPAAAKSLHEAQEDFDAVLKGYKPTHAVVDTEAPRPTDGGTSYYKGSGYTLTIVQSLERVAGVDGYMYGPSLVLLPPLAGGNYSIISHVTFYSHETFGRLLREHKP